MSEVASQDNHVGDEEEVEGVDLYIGDQVLGEDAVDGDDETSST